MLYLSVFILFLWKIMADVLSKTHLVSSSSSCVGYRKLQRHNSSFVVTKSCRIPSRVVPPALKSKTMLLTSGFLGNSVVLQGNLCKSNKLVHKHSVKAQSGLRLKNSQNWWDKGLQPNMKEVTSAQDLVDTLMNAGDKLVIVDFFSPGCGGCKALHPKICQMAEMNPDVIFLHVNYEEHKSMCHSLNVHVLPFFRFYRGAQGRVCSFSCTNATIKKFKDALAKHTPDRCSLGPTKGLEEKELIALAGNRDLNFTYTPKPEESSTPAVEETAPAATTQSPCISTLPLPRQMTEDLKEKTLVTSGR